MSIALSKKAIAGVVAAAALSFALVTPASAQTMEELTAQINSLLATIASLQAQLAGMGGTTTGGSCTSTTFTLSHTMGDQGGEVMAIQKFLNQDPATQVAATGAGSPGNESSYFGSLTKAAVVKFQNKYASEVLAPVGLTAGTGYWGASSRAKANSMGCTTTGGTTTTPTGTGLTVMAAAQPGNGLAVESAANLPYTKFTVTNNSGSAQTIDSVTVELGGVANKLAFSSVVLLDSDGTQIGLTKTLNSNKQATIGDDTVLAAGQSKTFTVAANMAAALDDYAGEVGNFSVVAINTSATVAGSLPITGASHTINHTLAIGSATGAVGVEDPNASQTKEIGTTGYVGQALKITAGASEDIRVHSVRWKQSGSASAGDLANVTLTFDGVEYTPSVSGDYYTFSFGSGVVISEGLSKEMVLSYDIVAGSGSTVIFDIRKKTDLIVTGETYGYGITPADGSGSASDSTSALTASTPWFDGAAVTISAGSVSSVSKSNAAPAANIAKQVADTVLGAFTVDLKGEAITVGTMVIDVVGAAADESITNATLVDQNGTVLAGPVDGATQTINFTFSSVELPVGVTTLYVKGKLDAEWDGSDTVYVRTNPSSDWSDVIGNTTGDDITITGADTSANTMTVQAATFTATTLTQPVARSVVKGAADIVFATFVIDAANSGEDVKVTAIIIEDTKGDAADESGDINNMEIWADLTDNGNDSVRGDKYETRVADAEQPTADTSATSTQTTVTLEQHVTITKNTSVEFAVVADLASTATTGDTHAISIDEAANAVTAVGLTSASTITGVTPTGAGQAMTVAASGDLVLTLDSSTVATSTILDSASEQTAAVFRLTANNVEDVDIDSIKITNDGTDDAVAKYVFYHGSTKLGEVTGGQNTAELFLADGTLVIPADDYELVTVKVVMNNIDGTAVSNGDTVRVTISADGDVDGTGLDSSAAIDPDDTNVDGYTLTMYEAIPSFAFDNTGVTTVLGASASYLAAKVVITNPGDKDIIFDGDDEITFQLEIYGDELTASTTAFTLQKEDGTALSTLGITGLTTNVGGSAEVVAIFEDNTLTIPAGGSETLQVRINTNGLTTDGDTLQVWLSDDTDDNIEFRVDGDATDYSEAADIFRGDIFGPVHTNPS